MNKIPLQAGILRGYDYVHRLCDMLRKDPVLIRNNTALINMNDDCLFLVLEQMDVVGLVNMAQVNERFYHLAKNVFKRMYSQHIRIGSLNNIPKLSIVSQFMDKLFGSNALHKNHKLAIYTGPSWIQINGIVEFYDYKLTLNVLKYFGDVIKRFDFEKNGMESCVIGIVYNHLNKYCASSLEHLSLGTIMDDWVKNLKGPFKNLKELSFDINHNMATIRLPMSEKFPNLQRLTVKNWYQESKPIFLDGNLSHLDYLKIEYSAEIQTFNDFLEQNPTIRHLEVVGFPKNYIKIINEFLPNLEILTIDGRAIDAQIGIVEPIHFEHLKVLHLLSNSPASMTQISFSCLEELMVYHTSDDVNQWIEFFAMNHTFTRFILHEDFDAEHLDRYIQMLIDALPRSVTEITIKSYSGLRAETIARIIQTRDNLIKLEYSTPRKLDAFQDEFRTATCRINWDITIPETLYTWNKLQFVRKNYYALN